MSATVTKLEPRPRDQNSLIEPGAYEATLLDCQTWMFFNGKSPRTILLWRIVTMGPAFAMTLPGYYAVRAIVGKPRRRGHFQIGPKSRLARDLAAMTGWRPPFNCVPIEDLADKVFRVRVETVGRDAEQEELAPSARYSVVRRVLGVAER
jgi:hypothetical protein